MSKRPVTICSGQFGDLPLDVLCEKMHALGYQGFEIATQAHVDVYKVVSDEKYREDFLATLAKHDMIIGALSAHLAGQCVGDNWDKRLDNFAPNAIAGQPEKIREWAIDFMKTTARAAQLLEGFAFNEIKRNGPLTFKYTDFQYLWYVNSAGFFYTRGNQRFI